MKCPLQAHVFEPPIHTWWVHLGTPQRWILNSRWRSLVGHPWGCSPALLQATTCFLPTSMLIMTWGAQPGTPITKNGTRGAQPGTPTTKDGATHASMLFSQKFHWFQSQNRPFTLAYHLRDIFSHPTWCSFYACPYSLLKDNSESDFDDCYYCIFSWSKFPDTWLLLLRRKVLIIIPISGSETKISRKNTTLSAIFLLPLCFANFWLVILGSGVYPT